MDSVKRNVWCLLGLPFDAIDMETTIQRIHDSARDRTPCFISTPNLNFLIASQKDTAFKGSVINSDMSVADGKPLVWLARLLGMPIPERVAGSDLIEALIENKKGYRQLKVFFFGGQEGIAQLACEKLNAQEKGLRCVGFHNPGFGSIEDMSAESVIDEINQSGADFVIVSLGAKKGQAWIEHNRAKLDAPIISHLGAVVNFIAGNVNRSPKLLQNLGLEWLWRIKEEPSLWKRYFGDGIVFIYLLLTRMIPYAITQSLHNDHGKNLQIDTINDDVSKIIISLKGGISQDKSFLLDQHLQLTPTIRSVYIDINELEYFDASFMGHIQIMEKILEKKSIALRVFASSYQRKMFAYNSCSYLLDHGDNLA